MRLMFILLSWLLMISSDLPAQEKINKDKSSEKQVAKADYSKEPVWIQMMQDPKVNYYEAVEAFESYWKGKVEPEEESELITEGKITEEDAVRMKKERASWTQAQRNEYELLKYNFKRFKQWKRDVKPYIQSDGRILTEQEKMDIYNRQQQNR